MKPNVYTVVVQKEAGAWHAYAPAVPGCFAGGKTRSEALRRFRSALRLHVQSLLAAGRQAPIERQPSAVKITIAA